MKIYHWSFRSYSFPSAGLIITGGLQTSTSVETFPRHLKPGCTIPPFPVPGISLLLFWAPKGAPHFAPPRHPPNPFPSLTCYFPPKGDVNTPSLSSAIVSNWSLAEGSTPRLPALLGAVGKMNGVTSQHWGKIKNIRSPRLLDTSKERTVSRDFAIFWDFTKF